MTIDVLVSSNLPYFVIISFDLWSNYYELHLMDDKIVQWLSHWKVKVHYIYIRKAYFIHG